MAVPVPSALSKLDTKVLSSKEQVDLAVRAKAGDVAARDKLIQHNLRFVWKISQKYIRRCRTTEIDDLVSEGVLGLMTAIDRFEPERGFAFITYASNWVRHHISRRASYDRSMAYVPVHASDAARNVATRRHELFALGLEPEEEEEILVKEFGAKAVLVERKTSVNGVSLDAEMGEDGGLTLYDVLRLEGDGGDAIADKDLDDHIRAVIERVRRRTHDERKLAILDRRLLGRETLADIAQTFGCSRERIRQLEAEVVALLKREIQASIPEEAHDRARPRPRRKTERSKDRVRDSITRAISQRGVAEVPIPAVRSVEVAANGLRVGQVVGAVPKDSSTFRRNLPVQWSDKAPATSVVRAAPSPAPPEPCASPNETLPMPKKKRVLNPSTQEIARRYEAGEDPREIAKVMGKPEASVRAKVSVLRRSGIIHRTPKRPKADAVPVATPTAKPAAVPKNGLTWLDAQSGDVLGDATSIVTTLRGPKKSPAPVPLAQEPSLEGTTPETQGGDPFVAQMLKRREDLQRKIEWIDRAIEALRMATL